MKKATKLNIKKGDNVKIITGDDRGKTGEVLVVFPKEQRVIVKGINMITKHIKPTAASPKGGIQKKEAPVHISNIMILDSSDKVTRIGRRLVGSGGKLERYAKTTKQSI